MLHLGVDIETAPGTPVVSPIDGTIRQRGKAYEKDERFDTIWIDGTGEYQGMLVKMFYVDRDGPVKGNDRGSWQGTDSTSTSPEAASAASTPAATDDPQSDRRR